MSDQVTALLEKASKIAITILQPAARCQTFSDIAETWISAGDKTRGLEFIAEALKIATLLKYPHEKSKQIARLARLLKETGEPLNASEQFKRAYYLARAAENPSQKVNALYFLSSEYLDAGLIEDSTTILKELEPLVSGPGSEVDTVCELINIAEVYADMTNTVEAQRSLGRALEAARCLKGAWFKVERIIEIARILRRIGSGNEALKLISEVISELGNLDESPPEAGSYFWREIAEFYCEFDMITEATASLLQARELVLKHIDSPMVVDDFLELAKTNIDLGDRISALDLLERSRTILEQQPKDQDYVHRLIQLASVYLRLGDRLKAAKLIENITEFVIADTDNKARLYILGKIAVLHLSLNNLDKVDGLIDELRSVATRVKIKTSGLGPIAEEMIIAGNSIFALKLADIIHEPEIKTSVFITAAKNLIENQAGNI